MDVDEEEALDVPDPRTGLVVEMGSRGRAGGTQATTVESAKLPGFTEHELFVNMKGATGETHRLSYPEAIVSRNAKVTARNVETRRRFALTDAKKLAAATKKVEAAARKAARESAKRSAA